MDKPLLAKDPVIRESSHKQTTKGAESAKQQTKPTYTLSEDEDVLDNVYEEPPQYRKMFYDGMLWILWTIFQCFFREIKSRGGFKIPKEGPVIFVAAPHANQFVDPVILMEQVKKAIDKRASFLIAESSLKMRSIGFFARCVMSIGVVRPQDKLAPAVGRITVSPNNYQKVIGVGTHFLTDCKPKGLIGLPKSMGSVEILSIESDTELILRKEFKMNKPEAKQILLGKGSPFKYADKVDQSFVYHKVFEHLAHDNCIGILPECVSDDRTDMLPLKAGVAIMALGCMDKNPDVNVKIVPCGMNYFHAHKFRSRAVVEFGDPIEIQVDLIEKYRNPETNREAVKTLLDTITEGLKTVTVTCRDYETLMVVQAMRRLYSTQFKNQLPLPLVVEMNRRLVKGFETYRDEPTVRKLAKDILKYNDHLSHYNIPDHLVETAQINFMQNLGLLVFKCVFMTIAFILSLPGIIMFSPVFILAKRISDEKARKALAKSTVKIKATDVMATWKILIGMGFAPILYIIWSVLISVYVSKYDLVSWGKIRIFVVSYLACATVTYSALIVGDKGMDTLKSIRPLYLSLTSPQSLKNLKKEREMLTARIVEVVNTFGTELFPDFDSDAFIKEYQSKEVEDRKTSELRRRRLLRKKKDKIRIKQEQKQPDDTTEEEADEAITQDSDAISLVNSDNSLSNIPLFSNLSSSNKSESSLTSFTNITSGSEAESDLEVPFSDKIESKSNHLSSKIAQAVMNIREKND